MNQDKKEDLRDYQSESFIEVRDVLRSYIKLNQVFANTQIRTKIYGQKVNGIEDLALTRNEKEIAWSDLTTLELVIKDFKHELNLNRI